MQPHMTPLSRDNSVNKKSIAVYFSAILMLISSLYALPATAQDYPSHPIKLVVPYAPGGGTDVAARALAELMGKSLGQPIIVENKGGGNTILGTVAVVNAEPDGYTILYATDANLVLNPLLYKNLPYDPERDLAPIGLLADVVQMLAIAPSVPARTIAEFVQYAKKHPGELAFGSAGLGGNGHLAAEMFIQDFKIQMLPVPFRGTSPALTAILSGTVQVYSGTVGPAMPHILAGKMIPLGVFTAQRYSLLPDVPTIAESGMPGFESSLRVGLVAPAKTPPDIIKLLNKALNEALASPAFREKLERNGYIARRPDKPQAYATANQEVRKAWGQIIKSKNLSLD